MKDVFKLKKDYVCVRGLPIYSLKHNDNDKKSIIKLLNIAYHLGRNDMEIEIKAKADKILERFGI